MSEHTETQQKEKPVAPVGESRPPIEDCFDPVTPAVRGVVIDREALRLGAYVRFVSRRRIESTYKAIGKDSENRVSWIYTFENRLGKGRPFAIFGTAELNALMHNVADGQLVAIRYKGQEKDEKDQNVHKWTVAVARSSMASQIHALAKEYEPDVAQLDRVIARAETADRDRRKQSAGGTHAGPGLEEVNVESDDDLPF